jgi:hypothetical protein
MGLNNERSGFAVFDIETMALPDAAEFLEPVEPPANYKNPDTIAAYIRDKQSEQLAKAALDVDLCQVVAIGLDSRWEDGHVSVLLASDIDERTMLRQFWQDIGDRHLVGFNVIQFDLPVLVRRSQYLGVPVPDLVLDTYRHPRVTDLAQLLSYHGRLRLRKLSFYAKRFQLPVVEDGITGAEVGDAWARGDWAAVARHVEADVRTTAALAHRLGVLSAPFAAPIGTRLEPQVVS